MHPLCFQFVQLLNKWCCGVIVMVIFCTLSKSSHSFAVGLSGQKSLLHSRLACPHYQMNTQLDDSVVSHLIEATLIIIHRWHD